MLVSTKISNIKYLLHLLLLCTKDSIRIVEESTHFDNISLKETSLYKEL